MAMAQNTILRNILDTAQKRNFFYYIHLNIMIFFQEKMWVTELISLVSAILKSH